MKKALFTYDYGPEYMDEIRALGYEVLLEKENEVVYSEALQDVEVLCCYHPFRTLDLKKMKSLKFIQLSSTGFDQIPEDIDPSIVVSNNHGGYSIPIGEFTVFRILEIYKRGRLLEQRQQAHKWKMDGSLLEVTGRKVGFIGTGTLAQEGSKRLQGFQMERIGFSRSGSPRDEFDMVYPIDQLNEWLPKLDIVVVTVPLTPETYHLMNRERLDLMQDGSVLINVSRGPVLDQQALLEVHEKFLGVALDVFEVEPLPESDPLWDLENVLVSSHNSWISEKRNARRFALIHENFRRFINGETPINIVNRERGY